MIDYIVILDARLLERLCLVYLARIDDPCLLCIVCTVGDVSVLQINIISLLR